MTGSEVMPCRFDAQKATYLGRRLSRGGLLYSRCVRLEVAQPGLAKPSKAVSALCIPLLDVAAVGIAELYCYESPKGKCFLW
jgi:hypothetical protein